MLSNNQARPIPAFVLFNPLGEFAIETHAANAVDYILKTIEIERPIDMPVTGPGPADC